MVRPRCLCSDTMLMILLSIMSGGWRGRLDFLDTIILSGSLETLKWLTFQCTFEIYIVGGWVGFMVFNAPSNNISVTACESVLLVEETEYPEKTSDLSKVIDFITECCIAWAGFELTTLVVRGTDCTSSCKSNYHTIMTMTTPSI
jgi:hypothetical protein